MLAGARACSCAVWREKDRSGKGRCEFLNGFTEKLKLMYGAQGTSGVPRSRGHQLAPTEVKFEFLKSSFFVVAVFLWPNRVVIRINMHQEATRPPPPHGPLGGSRPKKIFFQSIIFIGEISLFKNLSEL